MSATEQSLRAYASAADPAPYAQVLARAVLAVLDAGAEQTRGSILLSMLQQVDLGAATPAVPVTYAPVGLPPVPDTP